MKQFLKFLAGLVAIVSVIGGAYYVMKNFILKEDDFDDNFDDFDDFDDDEELDTTSENREYVTLNSENTPDENVSEKEVDTETTDTSENDDDFLIEE